jgi:hypothetical protein
MNLSKSILILFSLGFYLYAQNIHRGDGEYEKPKKIRQVDQRDYEKKYQFYWMTNRGNKWIWVNAPQGKVNKQRCY